MALDGQSRRRVENHGQCAVLCGVIPKRLVYLAVGRVKQLNCGFQVAVKSLVVPVT